MVTVQVCVMYTSFHYFSIFFFSRIFSAEKTVRFFHLFPVLFRRAALLSIRVSNNAQATLAPFRGTPRTRTHDANTYQLPRSASIYLLVSSSRRVPRRRFSLSSSPPPPVVTRDRLAGGVGDLSSPRLSWTIFPRGNTATRSRLLDKGKFCSWNTKRSALYVAIIILFKRLGSHSIPFSTKAEKEN